MKKGFYRFLAGTVLFVSMLMSFAVDAKGAQTETLRYVVSYKWGIIHKDAGDATLTMKPHGQNVELMLTARSRPWADRIFSVRDTLRSVTSGRDFSPLAYTKRAHEGGHYAFDEIKFTHTGAGASGHVRKTRVDKKGARTETSFDLAGSGKVFDMLSVFYYLRNVNYVELQQGKTVTATIFSGSDKAERVSIKFVKEETVETDKKTRRKAYLLKLGFTSDGRKKSSDDIRVWVSANGAHIPLLLIGSLPVGEVRVRLVS